MQMKRALLNDVLNRKPDTPLYHYTTQTGLLGVIRSREMWVTHTQYLNDRREFVHALDLVREEIKRLAGETSQQDSPRAPCLARMRNALQLKVQSINVCVCSFSEAGDSLSQWRAYGSGASGFAIGFPPDLVAAAAAKMQWNLAPCIYDPAKEREVIRLLAEEVLEENLARQPFGAFAGLGPSSAGAEFDKHLEGMNHSFAWNLLPYLYRYAPILKDESFSEEREWRVITNPLFCTSDTFCFREGRSLVIPYSKLPLSAADLKFSLHEVVVRPTPDAERSRTSVNSFLMHEHLDKMLVDVVNISKVPYRDW